jgi:hypothetical protein
VVIQMKKTLVFFGKMFLAKPKKAFCLVFVENKDMLSPKSVAEKKKNTPDFA